MRRTRFTSPHCGLAISLRILLTGLIFVGGLGTSLVLADTTDPARTTGDQRREENAPRASEAPAAVQAPHPEVNPGNEAALAEDLAEEMPGLEEILRLRRLVGDPFRGTVLESAGNTGGQSGAEQFAGALRKIVRQDPTRQESPPPVHTPAPGGSRTQCEQSYREMLRNPESPGLDPTPRGAAARLRQVARQVGQSAEDLEDIGRYSEADALREVAQRLRNAARANQLPAFD